MGGLVGCAQLLSKNNILSAPVLDKERNQYVGFIDMVDLAAFIVDVYTETDILGENFLSLLEQGERFLTTQVKDLISTFILSPSSTELNIELTLLSLLSRLCRCVGTQSLRAGP